MSVLKLVQNHYFDQNPAKFDPKTKVFRLLSAGQLETLTPFPLRRNLATLTPPPLRLKKIRKHVVLKGVKKISRHRRCREKKS